MDTLLQDVRYTLRQWRKSPGFLFLAVLTVSVGAGSVATMTSLTDAVLLRSLPGIRNPEELVEIRVGDRTGRSRRPMSYAAFLALARSEIGLAELAGGDYAEMSVSTGPGSTPELAAGVTASGNLFSVLGTRAALGRFFTPEEDAVGGAQPVVVLSHSYWMRRFGGDRSVLGATLTINRHPFTVIGVAERGFHGHLPLYDFNLFMPLGMKEALTGVPPAAFRLLTIGRIAPGSSLARVRSAMDGVEQELRTVDPAEWFSSAFVVEPHSRSFQEFRGPITLFLGFLLALAGFILLIACANLAGILLSRTMRRAPEVAVRKAIGASRWRLVRQMLTEVSLLFLLGGAGGAALAFWATEALNRIPVPIGIPLTRSIGPDLRVLGISMAITVFFGLLFGLTPVLRSTREHVSSALKAEDGGAPRSQRLRGALVVIQVVGTVVLLGTSGIFFRGLQRAGSLDLGFEPEGVHVATVDLGIQQYSDDDGRLFYSRLLEKAEAMQGVGSAALADFLFLASPPERGGTFSTADNSGRVVAGVFGVSPGFFETMGVEVIEGRPFNSSDIRGGEPVAMVNETVARILWPNVSPIGEFLRDGDSLLRVVGMVRNSKYISVGESPLAGVIRPQAQHYIPKTSLVLRVRDDWPSIGREVEEMVHRLDPAVPLNTNEPYSSLVGVHFLPRRLAAGFAGVLGGVGLFLAAVGLFAVLSNLVAQRSSELALRIALGADPGAVRWSVIWRGLRLVGLGVISGIPVAVGLSFLVRRFLYGLDPADPLTFGTIVLLLSVVGFSASYVPASRATRVDPARVLRQESGPRR